MDEKDMAIVKAILSYDKQDMPDIVMAYGIDNVQRVLNWMQQKVGIWSKFIYLRESDTPEPVSIHKPVLDDQKVEARCSKA